MSTRTPPPREKPRPAKDGEPQLIAENRKALHDYHVLETFEAGVQLLGTEVKGIREGKANLRDSYARVEKGEVWLYNVHINPYSHRGYVDHDPKRRRKLLLHREAIRSTRRPIRRGAVPAARGGAPGLSGIRRHPPRPSPRGTRISPIPVS